MIQMAYILNPTNHTTSLLLFGLYSWDGAFYDFFVDGELLATSKDDLKGYFGL